MPIQSLPLEVICSILELGAGDFSRKCIPSTSSRYTYLRMACLVCRHWRRPGQSLLWGRVRVWKEATAHKWLASAASGQHATWDLELGGDYGSSNGVSATSALNIVRKCYGVRRLVLQSFERLGCKVLESPSLAGLTNFTLISHFTDDGWEMGCLEVPFRLRELHLYNRPCDPYIIYALFRASVSTLTTLSLTFDRLTSYPGVVQALPLVAPSLRHLSINNHATPELISQLHMCKQLSVLDWHGSDGLAQALDTLSHPLQVLGVQLNYDLSAVVEIICPRLKKPSLAKLRRLWIRGETSSLVTSSQLMSDCEERDIVLEVI